MGIFRQQGGCGKGGVIGKKGGGEGEGRVQKKKIAMRLGPPPKGYANWTLRLLADKVVELEIVESISHETVRVTLKKTA